MLSDKPYAVLNWSKDGQASSCQFDDIYFSKQSGADESYYVFLEQSRFLERTIREPLQIIETGFGSGLNFLQVCSYAVQPVHYFSIEKYPLKKDHLAKILKPFKSAYKAEFLDQYDPRNRTNYTVNNVELEIFWGDIQDAFEYIKAQNTKADIWFLDGFAPAKNPQMWPLELFEVMRDQSNLGATVSTFTAAAKVRRGLELARFNPQKVAGFGRKREMLVGKNS